MNPIIRQGRIHLMSPCAHVCAVAALNQQVPEPVLRDAIQKVMNHHRILCSRIVMDADGTARFQENTAIPEPLLEAYAGTCVQLLLQQESIPFTPCTGYMIRFFYQHTDGHTDFAVIAHHIVCDGGSLMLFMKDVLLALNRQQVSVKPLQLLSPADLPKHPKLNPIMRIIMRQTNANWAKNGRCFTFADCLKMREQYNATHPSALYIREIGAAQLDALTRLAHQNSITVNSLLTAAFAAAWPAGESIGLAVSIRPQGFGGMGNYATGIGIKAACDARKMLLQNAVRIHRQIMKKLRRPGEKYFLYEFMNTLASTLVDSIHFARYGGYRNPVSEAICRMCGYTDVPRGISLSNLTRIDTQDDPIRQYRYDSLFFVPPYIPNVRGVIGISTYRNTMTISLHTENNARLRDEKRRFDQACDLLADGTAR